MAAIEGDTGTQGDIETQGDTMKTQGDTGRQGDTVETQGDTLKTQGDTGERQGDTVETQGDTLKTQGDTGTQGDTLKTQGDTGERQGDTGERQGDTLQTQGDTGERQGDTLQTQGDTEQDSDLDELLDSALKDFVSQPPPSTSTTTSLPPTSATSTNRETLFPEGGDEQLLRDLLGGIGELGGVEGRESDFLKRLERLAETAQRHGSDEGSEQEFNSCLQETLAQLNLGGAEEELVGGAGGGDDDAMMTPLMRGVMASLLSKEVLYPSVKELTDKFPPWLEAHSATLSREDFGRYEAQWRLMTALCREFEREAERESAQGGRPGDSADAQKEESFNRVMDLMQRMQELGHPPQELCGDGVTAFSPPMGFPENPDQCVVM